MITSTLKILSESDKETCEVVKVSEEELAVGKKRLFIESYGCQMNFSDSEIVAAVMRNAEFATTSSEDMADVVFLNTCSIRDNAEQKVRNRLTLKSRSTWLNCRVCSTGKVIVCSFVVVSIITRFQIA